MDLKNQEGLEYLTNIDNNSIDLVLTDPPYITSKETGMAIIIFIRYIRSNSIHKVIIKNNK